MKKVKNVTCGMHVASGTVVATSGSVSSTRFGVISKAVVTVSGVHPAALGAACTAIVTAESGSLGGRCASDTSTGSTSLAGGAATSKNVVSLGVISVASTITAAGSGRTSEGATVSAELRCTLSLVRVATHVSSLTAVGPTASPLFASLMIRSTSPGGRVSAVTGTAVTACVPIPGKLKCKQPPWCGLQSSTTLAPLGVLSNSLAFPLQ